MPQFSLGVRPNTLYMNGRLWPSAVVGDRQLPTPSGPSIQTAYTTGSNIEESLGSEG